VALRSPVSPLHPSVCSVGAGGLWMPFHCDDPRRDKWALETLNELWLLGKDKSKSLVEIMTAIKLHRSNAEIVSETTDTKSTYPDAAKLPRWTFDPRLEFQQLTVEMLSWQNTAKKLRIPNEEQLIQAGYMHSWMFETPVVDSPRMLSALLEEVELHPDSDINVETGEYYDSIEHMQDVARSLDCEVLINCSGMGSQKVCQDSQLVGGRGVLLQLERENCPRRASIQGMEKDAIILAECPPWGSDSHPCYLIPRGDVIAIGGTYLEGDGHPELRASEREQLKQNAKLLGVDIETATIRGEWTGFRPARPVTRCEEEITSGSGGSNPVRVIHNYGQYVQPVSWAHLPLSLQQVHNIPVPYSHRLLV